MTILQRVYQAHDMVLSNMAICGAVCAVAPLLQWAFVHGLGWGYNFWLFVRIASRHKDRERKKSAIVVTF